MIPPASGLECALRAPATSARRVPLVRLSAAVVLVLAALAPSHRLAAEDDANASQASVLVEARALQRGEIPARVTAYGTAMPAINGAMTLSVPAEGRVMHISATPGEAVHAGQPLLEFSLSAAATSAHSQAVSALTLARAEQTRITRLLEQQLATREQKAQADKTESDARAALGAIERETGGRPQQTVFAPFDGVIGAVAVAQGERIGAGAALITITRANGLVVTCGIEPSDIKSLQVGQHAEIESLASGPGKHSGKLIRIDHSLNPKTRLIDADLAIDDDVLQGDAFRAEIQVGTWKGWLAPRNAVLEDDQGSYVFQLDGNKAVRVDVQRIGGDADTAVVDGAIDAAREIVVAGNYQLQDGMTVRKQAGAKGKSDASH